MSNPSLPLADAFKAICESLDNTLSYPNPDNVPGGWQSSLIPPYLQFSSEGLEHVSVGTHSVGVLRLVHSLMSYAYSRSSVAFEFWQRLVGDPDIKLEIDYLIQVDGTDRYITEASKIKPKSSHSWNTIAKAVAASSLIKSCMRNFAKEWFENLLIPYMAVGSTPKPGSAKTANRNQNQLRDQLLSRDGYISPIGDVLELSIPSDKTPPESDYSSSASLQAAHIIPFCASSRGRMREMLQIFSGGDVLANQFVGEDINAPSNGLLLAVDHHDAFAKFIFSIDATSIEAPTKYTIKLFKPAKRLPAGLHKYRDNDEIQFGSGPEGATIPKPSPTFLRLHTTLAKIFQASRVAEAIMAMMRDEEELKASGATAMEWGVVGADYIDRQLSGLGVA